MLAYLAVRNLAIVEEAEVAFGAGLNVITGETGAGKSVLMGALGLVLGERADKGAIREGAQEAAVEATFALAEAEAGAVDAVLAEAGLPLCEEGTLLVRRSVSAAGAGRCLVNDAPVTLQTLRRLGSLLVDIHGPYDHQSLLNGDFQRDVLDAYGQCAGARAAYGEAWGMLRGLEERLAALQGDEGDVAAEMERVQYVVDEIAGAALTEADGDELVERHAEAANAEQIVELGSAVMEALTEGEPSAFGLLAGAQAQLTELGRVLPEAEAWRAEAQGLAVQLQELGRAVQERVARVEAEPERLRALEERMALVQRLRRKYGSALAEVRERLRRGEERLEELATRTERAEALEAEVAEARQELARRAAALTKARAKAAGKLARAVTGELHGLGFLRAGFAVTLGACAPAAHGADEVVFGFAPNPGEPMRPLRAIASSGEIARVMLAVKTVLAAHDAIPVLVFDEIDSNIGGEVGRAVGERLRRVAERRQVISITHLPQSAVYGRQHFVVRKEVAGGRTRMRIARLDEAGRVDEVARMLGGKDSASVVVSHARELLAGAAKEGRDGLSDI